MPLITVEVDGMHKPPTSKRDFTLQYLEGRGIDGAYVKEIFDAWVDFCIQLGKKPGNYKDYRTAIWNMKNEGVIEKFKEEPVYNKWNRVYYRLSI